MNILKTIGLIVLTLIVLGGAFIAQSLMRFDLLFNDTVQAIRTDPSVEKWGDRVQLIPDQFERSETREIVLSKLKRDGFARTPDLDVWGRYQYEVEGGREIYQREGNDFVCSIQYYVFIEFDDQNRLAFAEGTQHEHGCL